MATESQSGPLVETKFDWQNSPTVRHGMSAVFAFADGHAEVWHWRVLNRDQHLSFSHLGLSVDTTPDLRRVQRAVYR